MKQKNEMGYLIVTNAGMFPELARMAHCLLSIPPINNDYS